MSDVDPQLLQIFREETNERLERIDDLLLGAEAGAAAADCVDALFRDAHSIKGNAGMVGFAPAASIASAMEEILAQARDSGVLEAGLIGPLLSATDAIRRAIVVGNGDAQFAAGAVRALQSATPTVTEPAAFPPQPALRAGVSLADAPSNRIGRAQSVRVSTEKVDRMLEVVGESVLHQRRLDHLLLSEDATDEETLREELHGGAGLLTDLQDAVIQMRTLPLSSILGPFPRAVRDIAAQAGRDVSLSLSGTETQLDRVILDGLSEVLSHLLRNAIFHGIESPQERVAAGKPARGVVQLSAEQRGGMVAVTVTDDGHGISEEIAHQAQGGSLTSVLAQAGFSTAPGVTDLAGRGVGLDAVQAHVASLGGTLELQSRPGAGMRATLLLPLTLALLDILLVERGGQAFGLPLSSVAEAVRIGSTTHLGGRPAIELRGGVVALADLAEVIRAPAPALDEHPPAVVVAAGARRVALACDRLLGDQQALIRSLGPLLAGLSGYLGAAILSDGRVALIIDPSHVVHLPAERRTPTEPQSDPRRADSDGARVLVVDDQFTVRELQRRILEGAHHEVLTAADGQEALELLGREKGIELVITDIEMPRVGGFELLETIRREQRTHSLPVVVVSSRGSAADRQRGAEAGADAYVVKAEFNQRALLEIVERLTGRG